MRLSVIIVNYNVEHFLVQCLHSVQNALHGIDAEVFVVDNNSVDGSVRAVKEKFPSILLIENKINQGFSRANNQAVKVARGEYILLLNPDTVVQGDTFTKILAFMDTHPEAGALGVMMVDGKGRFLPESKRGLPTPAAAFYKMSGLARIFPKSRVFGKYHLAYLNKDSIHQVEVLSGAFMLLRKKVIDEIGMLDESFFMYGEDIDLSYRITKAGYKNYYFPETRIIHYKGESTKKGSLNYVLTFYNAMIVFARKHYTQGTTRVFLMLIHLAIWMRATLSIASRFLQRLFLPLTDAALTFAGIFFIKNYWEKNIIYLQGGSYPSAFMNIAVPGYILVWILSNYFSGSYDQPIRPLRVLRGVFWGTLAILVIYALLPEEFRFSRALILFGAVWAGIGMASLRVLLHFTGNRAFQMKSSINRRYLVVGEPNEAERVAELLHKTDLNPSFIGLVSVQNHNNQHAGFIGNISQVKDIINIYQISEVIFCARDLPANRIIDLMSEMSGEGIEYKIAPAEGLSIIGSSSISTLKDAYMLEINSIASKENKRNKRLFDFLSSLIILVLSPIFLLMIPGSWKWLKNLWRVVTGKYTWVGYQTTGSDARLPVIKTGIFNPTVAIEQTALTTEDMDRLNLLYARNYSVYTDLHILLNGIRLAARRS